MRWALIVLCVLLAGCPPRTPEPPAQTPFGTTQAGPPPSPTPAPESRANQGGALVGDIYFLPENTERLPDFSTLRPAGQVRTSTLDIAPRKFDDGFPAISQRFEWFAIDYQGACVFDLSGVYRFRVVSDDGAKLYIENRLVLDNDGIHSPTEKAGEVRIEAGRRQVRVSYFQGPRFDIALQLYVTRPGGTQEEIFVCR